MDVFVKEAIRLAEGQIQETRSLKSGELQELRAIMRSKVPVEGDDWFSFLLVVIRPGMSIPRHQHPEYVCLFYAELADTPVIIDGVSTMPKVGDFLVLPPNEWHEVCLNTTEITRVSIAMKVPVPNHGE